MENEKMLKELDKVIEMVVPHQHQALYELKLKLEVEEAGIEVYRANVQNIDQMEQLVGEIAQLTEEDG